MTSHSPLESYSEEEEADNNNSNNSNNHNHDNDGDDSYTDDDNDAFTLPQQNLTAYAHQMNHYKRQNNNYSDRQQQDMDMNVDYMLDSGRNYVFSRHMVELCMYMVVFGFIGVFLPTLFKVHQRSIPYQIVESTGDVILDFNHNYEYKDEQIDDYKLLVLSMILPMLILLGLEIWNWNGHFFHDGACAFIAAMTITLFFTGVIKRMTGILRPNFYEQCNFSVETLRCMSNDYDEDNIRMSFVSGHASVAFCGLTMLTLIFLGASRVYSLDNENRQHARQRNTTGAINIKEMRLFHALMYSPILLAIYIGSTRLVDYYHHEADVIGGAFLGASIAVLAYHVWYPSIRSTNSGIPRRLLVTT